MCSRILSRDAGAVGITCATVLLLAAALAGGMTPLAKGDTIVWGGREDPAAPEYWLRWWNPVVKQWACAVQGRNPDTQHMIKAFSDTTGAFNAPLKKNGQIFALAETNAPANPWQPDARPTSFSFTPSVRAKVRYRKDKKSTKPWIDHTISTAAGVSWKQQFMVVASDGREQAVPGQFNVSGFLDAIGECMWTRMGCDAASGVGRLRFAIAAPGGEFLFKPKNVDIAFDIRDPNPEKVTKLLEDGIMAALAARTMDKEKMARKSVAFFKEVIGLFNDDLDEGQSFGGGEPQRIRFPRDAHFISQTPYELQVDFAVSVIRSGGTWGALNFGDKARRGITFEVKLNQGGHIPEPATLVLLALGSLTAFRDRRRS